MVESVKLVVWVFHQRRLYKDFMNGKNPASFTDKQIAELNALGFEWKVTPDDSDWFVFELLCACQQEHRHCQVPQRFVVESVQLGVGVACQRRFTRKTSSNPFVIFNGNTDTVE